MASFASDVSVTQCAEFFARFGRFGGSMEKLQKLLGDDELMERWVKRLDEYLGDALIHSVFNTTESVLAAFKARCLAKGVDLTKFSWIGSEVAPEFDPEDPETVVVLDATFATLKQTLEFAWEWTKDGQEDSWHWEGMVSDASKLRLLSDNRKDNAKGDGADFMPWTISWCRIKLDTNVGKKPADVRDPKTSPGCALLFMSAEHPARVKATDYETRFGFFLPGLKCTAPGGEAWRRVPCVDFYRDDRQVELNAYPDGSSYGHLAVPCFRE